MSDDLIERLKAATEGTTPGPWSFGRTGDEQRMILGGSSGNYVANVQIYQTPRHMGQWQEPEREANARFIAESRELVPAMRDRIEADAKRIERGVNAELLDQQQAMRERIAELEAEREELTGLLKCVVSHATMGEMTSIDENLNDICVKITKCRNTVFDAGKEVGVKTEKERAEARGKVLEDEIKRLRLAVKLAKSAADEWAISRKIGSPVIEGDKADALWKAMRRLSAISYGPIQGSTLEGEK